MVVGFLSEMDIFIYLLGAFIEIKQFPGSARKSFDLSISFFNCEISLLQI